MHLGDGIERFYFDYPKGSELLFPFCIKINKDRTGFMG